MPHLTQSPLSSPSLRTIAHSQFRTSYFPPVPNAPHSYHGRVPPTPHSSLNVVHHSPQPNLGSPLVGCLKHTQHISSRAAPSNGSFTNTNTNSNEATGPYHRGGGEYDHTYIKPAMKSLNINEKRRTSLKVSQIPFSSNNNQSRGIHTSSLNRAQVQSHSQAHSRMNNVPSHLVEGIETKQRRPSFKIELPPRPVTHSSSTNPMMGQMQMVESPISQNQNQIQNWSSFTPPAVAPSGPKFTDPFQGATYDYPAGGYMILRAPTKVPGNFFDEFPSPTQQTQEWEGIGLGYSLNKRVATPWLRSKGDEEEWLKADDLESVDGAREVEKRIRGLGVA
ncbi:uncharacterized protein IL334_003117 [Kwoniella shivajii]|uniref:Uncharacterized protein n=1 Tax=Kwoniella shivajii TaxID=564305 RepID=A0ABZ1CXX3_9TREE|nr:hypothetical protein IL334_003117 [Kwoniella shivajii]